MADFKEIQIGEDGQVYQVKDTTARQSSGGYTPPVGGIPKSDLASDVQTSLGKADTALQSSDKSELQSAITSLQNALNTLIGSGNVQGAIDTFNEVKAFLNGIDTDDPTLANQLLALNNAISALQTSLAAKANAADIPENVSELENDEGYITASEVSGIVAASGDMVIVETSDYIDIIIRSAEIGITPSVVSLHASGKSQTIKVSGSHLKADINISVPTGFTATPSTIQHVGGVVAETDVVIAYTGADASAASGSITATSGDVTKSIPVAYTQYAGPTIITDKDTMSFAAGVGSTQQKTITVNGVNLTGNIALALSGTNAGKFSLSVNSIAQSDGTASAEVTVTYNPVAGDTGTHTATLTLSSSGATNKVITLNGAVSSLTVSKQTMSFSTDQGVAVTDTFTIEGANLNEDISIAASGTGFSVSPQTIAHNDGTVASTAVTVTYSPTTAGTHSGSISIQSSGVTKTITLSGTAAAAAVSDAEGKFTKKDVNGNTLYLKRDIVNGEKTTDVYVYQSNYLAEWNSTIVPSYSGDVVIPAKVVVDGVTCDVVGLKTNSFKNCNGLKSLTLPEGLKSISLNALNGCSNTEFTELTIPSSVISIGGGFLNGCHNLAKVNMLCADNPDFATTSLGQAYNAICVGLTDMALSEFVVPDKVQKIENGSFAKCSNLKRLTLGTDMKAFRGILATNFISAVEVIICRGTTTIPTPNGDESTSFSIYGGALNATVYVPDGYVEAYAAKSCWASYHTAGRLKPISELTD